MACVLILLTLSFIEQKSSIAMKSGLSIILFIDHAFDVVSKKYSPYAMSSYAIFQEFYGFMFYI